MAVLSLYQAPDETNALRRTLADENVLERLTALDARISENGLAALAPESESLIPIGTEINASGAVTKNSYGVLNLAWRAQAAGDWPARVEAELDEIRARIQEAHATRLRFLIWAGMGGSAEDKTMYNAAGLLKRGPKVYVLDSTDPAKLKAILADMEQRSAGGIKQALQSALVVGMAMGMTSYEPVVNLEKLAALYDKHKIDGRPNFVYMTLPGSILDQFASARGFRRVELQLDNGNTTAGRHSGPLTRGSLYPLGLAGNDLNAWIDGTNLDASAIDTAFHLAAFLEASGREGRDKVTLLLPKPWEGAGLWTKQDFEESLGKSEAAGIKIVIGEKPKLAHYKPAKAAGQDRVFLAVRVKGAAGPDAEKLSLIRRKGYPVAVLTLAAGTPLSTYMQLMHYTVFALGYLRQMNFVTQPSVELYKAITSRIHADAEAAGGIRETEAWRRFGSKTARHRAVTLHYGLVDGMEVKSADAPGIYAELLRRHLSERGVEHGELTFFGDMRYSDKGKKVRGALDRAANAVFRGRLNIPVDVYEGPAMNHSYHEMIIGHGRCFSTVLLSEKAAAIPAVNYTAGYHTAQFLATQMALAERGRAVVALVVKDLEPSSIASLDEFFRLVAQRLKQGKG